MFKRAPDKIQTNMIKWFSENEWAVLCRSPSLGMHVAFRRFIGHQIRVNLPRLSLVRRVRHTLLVIRILGMHLFFRLYRGLRTVLSSIQSNCQDRPG